MIKVWKRDSRQKKSNRQYIHVHYSFLVVLSKDPFRIDSFYGLNMGKG
jgi:hypothetical protein